MSTLKTFADGFSGFGGAKIGALAAGLTPLWSNEKDPEIASINQNNFPDDWMIVADFLELDPTTLPAPDVMHWSPPCINASVAKQADENGVRESELDREFSKQIVRFTECHHPKAISLENVYGYRNFQAFQGGDDCEGIVPAFWRLGYHVRWWHLNSSDFGVPQTRKRLIMLAARDFIPQRPLATHQDPKEINGSQMDMFATLQPWIGWYEAIADLVPDLPVSQFAPWQLARLPEELRTALIYSQTEDAERGKGYKETIEPSYTVTSHPHLKALIINPNRNSFSEGWSSETDLAEETRPMFSIAAQKGLENYRAFIMEPTEMRGNGATRQADEPIMTIKASRHENFKAFIIDGNNENNFDGVGSLTIREGDNPVFTVKASSHAAHRAWSQGRVVKMTARALARFQSFPDSYILPEKNSLACKGIGNACPPLLMEKIYKGLVNA